MVLNPINNSGKINGFKNLNKKIRAITTNIVDISFCFSFYKYNKKTLRNKSKGLIF